MSEFLVKIENIVGGMSPVQNFGAASQFDSSIGIDPDMPTTDSSVRMSGMLRPTAMTKFSSTNVTNTPLWFLTNPKNDLVYAYMSDGKVTSYNSSLSGETLVATLASSSGNGALYYDNYLYFATNTDIARYGPLNGAPVMTTNYWTSTLGLAALTNTTYPTINGILIPNHILHYHASSNKLYFANVVGGKTTISFISTTKTTVEGDTNNGATSNKFTSTPYGYLPTCMANYGSDIAIGCIQGTSNITTQRSSVILFWDGSSAAATKTISVEIPDMYITAMKNVNGSLYAWTGNSVGGCRLIKFQGGYSWTEVAYFEESFPPLHGATDHDLNRIIFAGNTTYPEASASVWAVGSRKAIVNASSPGGLPIHNILRTTSVGATPMVTALRYVTQSSNAIKQPIVGWKDASSQGIDKITTGGGGVNQANVWRSQIFRVGKKFSLNRIRIPLTSPVVSGTIITATFYIDELTASQSLGNIINFTNYVNGEKNIAQRMNNVKGNHSFMLELRWTGTILTGVALPITIHGEVLTDGTE